MRQGLKRRRSTPSNESTDSEESGPPLSSPVEENQDILEIEKVKKEPMDDLNLDVQGAMNEPMDGESRDTSQSADLSGAGTEEGLIVEIKQEDVADPLTMEGANNGWGLQHCSSSRKPSIVREIRPFINSVKKMRDDPEFNIQFCEEVEEHPLLYDYTKSGYCNRYLQDRIWGKISKNVNATVDECKDRWKNIRNRYTKYKKTLILPSGSSAKPKREYYLAPHLMFLNNFIKTRHPQGNHNNNKKMYNADSSEDEGSEPPPIPTESEDNFVQPPDPQIPSRRKSRSTSPFLKDVNKSAYDYLYTKKNTQNTTDTAKLPDTDLSFLQSVLPDMKSMSPAQKRKFKIGILNLAGAILEDSIPHSSSNFRNSWENESSLNRAPSCEFDSNSRDSALSVYPLEHPHNTTPAVHQNVSYQTMLRMDSSVSQLSCHLGVGNAPELSSRTKPH